MRDFRGLEPTIDHNVKIRVINSPTDFWCQMSDNAYEYLQEKLLDSYSNSSDKLQNIEVGNRCVIKLKEEGFFRGYVLGLDLDEDRVTVLCVDNGYIHEVTQADIFKYKLEFDKFPQLAFLCAFDIKSVSPAVEWDKDVCDKLKEIVLESSEVEELPADARVNLVRLEEDSVIVKLTVGRLVIDDYLVKLDLAELCDKVEKLEIKEELKSETSQEVSDFGSFVNIKLSVDSEHSLLLVDCDNLDELVFHTIDGAEVVEEIAEKIAEFVKDHEPSDENWLEGQACLGKCPEDNLWYRANILTVTEDKCQVSTK